MRISLRWTSIAISVLLAAATAAAQAPESAKPAPLPTSFALGLRLGAFDMINSDQSYDAVFGDPMLQTGVDLQLRVRGRFLLALTADYGKADGERVLPTGSPLPTGFPVDLTYLPIHLTLGWVFHPQGPWDWYLGGGPSLVSWKEESLGESTSSDDNGYHAVIGVERQRAAWGFGGELRYSTFPDAVGEGGITEFYGEDDIGGMALHFVARYRF